MVHLADTPHPYGLSGWTFWLVLAAFVVYTVLVAAGGMALGRLDREERRAERRFAAQETAAHRAPSIGLPPDDVDRIPLTGVPSHRKGRRP